MYSDYILEWRYFLVFQKSHRWVQWSEENNNENESACDTEYVFSPSSCKTDDSLRRVAFPELRENKEIYITHFYIFRCPGPGELPEQYSEYNLVFIYLATYMEPLLPERRVHKRNSSSRKRVEKGHVIVMAAVMGLFLYGAYIRLNKEKSTNISYIRQPVSAVELNTNSMESNVRTKAILHKSEF